jgi:hypothetical protein
MMDDGGGVFVSQKKKRMGNEYREESREKRVESSGSE